MFDPLLPVDAHTKEKLRAGPLEKEEIDRIMVTLLAQRESKADSETIKIEAGIMLRGLKVRRCTQALLEYAAPKSKAPLEQKREAWQCLDDVLTAFNNFLSSHVTPEQ